MKPLIVTSYPNPDLDGTACAIAYAELLTAQGRPATPYLSGPPHLEAQYLLDTYNIPFPAQPVDLSGEVVLTDTSSPHGLPAEFKPEQVVEVIDHRQSNQPDYFPNATLQVEPVGAAATLIAEKFMQAKLPVSEQAAVLLYGAIISNTLNFQATHTTERDHAAASWLAGVVHPTHSFAEELFAAKSNLTDLDLYSHLASDFVNFHIGDHTVGIAQLEIVHTDKLVSERKAELLAGIARLQQENHSDYAFITIIELVDGYNLFLTDHQPTQELLHTILGAQFEGPVAKRLGFIMRKQIVPLLQQELQ